MVRMSVPASSRWVAKLCRRVWTVTCLPRPGGPGGLDADPVHRAGGEGPARDVAGEEPVGRPGGLPVLAEQGQQPGREHDVAVLAALALADAEDHALAVDVVDAQGDDLGDPQAGGVGGHEDGAVLEAGDGREEPGDLGGAEDDGELLRLLGAGDAVQDPLPAEGDVVEEPEGGDGLVVDAPGDVLLLDEVEEVGADLVAAQEPRATGRSGVAKVATRET